MPPRQSAHHVELEVGLDMNLTVSHGRKNFKRDPSGDLGWPAVLVLEASRPQLDAWTRTTSAPCTHIPHGIHSTGAPRVADVH